MSAVTTAAPPRERLLAAARELFYVDGITLTGVDALAARAGVSKRTLYREFGSKDELVRAYLERFGEPGGLPPEDVLLDDALPPAERITGAFTALEAAVTATGFRGCPAANALAELPDPTSPGRRAAQEHKHRFRARLEAALRELGADDPVRTARWLALVWDGALAQASAEGSARPVRDARALVTTLLDRP